MITVTRYTDSITVTGHANYAEMGKDIVCSAISTLTQTLIQAVEQLTEDKIEYSISPGKVDIKFWCLSGETKTLINAFFIGVKMVADGYPDNVKIGYSGIPNN